MFYLSYFTGKRHFDCDGSRNYLVFQPVSKSLEIFPGTFDIFFWIEV